MSLPRYYFGQERPDHFCETDIARFYQRVKKLENGCWEMGGQLINSGYTRINVGKERFLGHRFSYLFFKGAIADSLYVCHTCDYKRCVNPAHLFLGTNSENQQDAKRKGRLNTGPRVTKLYCIRGHIKSGANRMKRPGGYFACRECSNLIRRNKLNDDSGRFLT